MADENQDDAPTPLVGSPAIEKVLDLQEVSTFSVRGILAYGDTVGGDYPLTVLNPVPVFSASGLPIGHASVFTDGRRLVADFFIDRASPERLDIEMQLRQWFPDATVLVPVDDKAAARIISITLRGTTDDARLNPLGWPVL